RIEYGTVVDKNAIQKEADAPFALPESPPQLLRLSSLLLVVQTTAIRPFESSMPKSDDDR
ncbi:MAG TPA: hypothetical protein VKP13_06500, partial [Nitrospira sp.]|nr:hypothetical protein [Nitrospira sp.]